MEKLKELTSRMLELTHEISSYKSYKKKVREDLEANKDNPAAINNILKGKTRRELIDSYNLYILQLLSYLDYYNQEIALFVGGPKPHMVTAATPVSEPSKITAQITQPKKSLKSPSIFPIKKEEKIEISQRPAPPAVSISRKSMELVSIDEKTKKAYLNQLGIGEYYLKKFRKGQKIENIEEKEFSIYESSFYGKLCNTFFESITMSLTKNPGKIFGNLKYALVQADIKILSKTYVSMMLFTSMLVFFLTLANTFVLSMSKSNLINSVMISVLLSMILGFLTLLVFYVYPFLLINSRARAIKNDLPFVIIHMAAVAGSGANPVSMFHLILTTGEYKGMEREVNKILNYVNLFGYDLSSALRAVSLTTPSKPFKDLLNGITSTIESGGNLAGYLKGKAEDAMNNYKLERKKYVESLSTYSDIYTGVLIAAPLLFIVTLAIINLLGGQISGLSVATISTIGAYIVLPVLNVMFILFLNIIQPEV
ncbi:MAG TPA: type II secretion system F family protein [Candidatus Nanoarchaeia archaeon]|nr:type II secretion system F family protein [Candidatus Nanoarchaeia archaeon]